MTRREGKLCVPCGRKKFQCSHACRYSGCTRATLRNSFECVRGHCISHQLMGTIWAPDSQKEKRIKDVKKKYNYTVETLFSCYQDGYICTTLCSNRIFITAPFCSTVTLPVLWCLGLFVCLYFISIEVFKWLQHQTWNIKSSDLIQIKD